MIPKADWGTRAFIYVYCLEPICNLKMGGESKYLVRLSEPIADEQALMVDYGSGKYRLQLVNRKAGANNSDALDVKEIEIYNPKYPPKIPRSVWMNDPRNERWAALLPPVEVPQPATGLGTLTDAFKTFGDIRRDLKEEMAPAGMGMPVTDPMASSLQMVQTIMAMKADNPMVEIMKLQLQSVNDQAEKAREREANLQKELRDIMFKMSERKAEPPAEKFGLKQTLAELKEFLPSVKELLPGIAETTRATRSSWIDLARDIAPGAIDYVGKIAYELVRRMPQTPAAQQNGAQPAAAIPAPSNGQPAAQQPQQAAPPPQEIPAFVRFLSQPFVFDGFRRYFDGYLADDGQTGADFAEWVFDGGGAEPLKNARAMGSAQIMALLKQSPAWVMFRFGEHEAKLVEFVDSALTWAPPAEESEEDDDEDEKVDLTAKGV
jgi:hypothetical protein